MATTKTEQRTIEKPKIPQSVAYRNLKQQIMAEINLSGLPAWMLTDMLTNIAIGIQTVGEQMTANDSAEYNKNMDIFKQIK